MSALVTIHARLSISIWLFFLIIGLWGVYRAIRRQGVDGSYLGALAVGEVVYIVQGILGGILWANGLLGSVARPSMHVLYGAFAVVFLPFIYFVVLRGEDSNRAQWVLGLATLFLFGIALRAISTGA